MYRVLFATNEPAVLEPLNQITNWQSMSFHDPMLAGNADEAIRLMESKRVDAIAYMLNADDACMPICPTRYTTRPRCWISCAMR